jgi:hypothetical protein
MAIFLPQISRGPMSSTLCAIRSKSARQPDELSWATEEPIDVSPADGDQLVPERLPLGKRVSRALSRFLITFCIGVVATLAWQSHDGPPPLARWGFFEFPKRVDRHSDDFLCGTGTSERFDNLGERVGDGRRLFPPMAPRMLQTGVYLENIILKLLQAADLSPGWVYDCCNAFYRRTVP